MNTQRTSRIGSLLAACLISAACTVVAPTALGVTVWINTPTPNTAYSKAASISYSGTFSWSATDPSVDLICVLSVRGSDGNPALGTIVSSNYANITNKTYNQEGGGSGSFNSSNVTPALEAPNDQPVTFYVSARPENASQGLFWSDNPHDPDHPERAYFAKVEVQTTVF